MKIRRQFIGKAPVQESIAEYERRILAMERAGLVPTHKVTYTSAPPYKRRPDEIPHERPETTKNIPSTGSLDLYAVLSNSNPVNSTADSGPGNYRVVKLVGSTWVLQGTLSGAYGEWVHSNGYVPREGSKPFRITDTEYHGFVNFSNYLNRTIDFATFTHLEEAFADVAIANDGIAYKSSFYDAYKSIDGMQTFSLILDASASFPSGDFFSSYDIAVCPTNSDFVVLGGFGGFSLTEYHGYGNPQIPYFFISVNGGSSWNMVPLPESAVPDYGDIVDMDDWDVSDHRLMITPEGEIVYFTEWIDYSVDPFGPNNTVPRKILGIVRSADQGATWSHIEFVMGQERDNYDLDPIQEVPYDNYPDTAFSIYNGGFTYCTREGSKKFWYANCNWAAQNVGFNYCDGVHDIFMAEDVMGTWTALPRIALPGAGWGRIGGLCYDEARDILYAISRNARTTDIIRKMENPGPTAVWEDATFNLTELMGEPVRGAMSQNLYMG